MVRSHFQFLFSLCSNKRQLRITKAKKEDKKLILICSEILAIYSALLNLDIKVGEITFAYTEKGKPYIDTKYNYHFNISHSKNLVLCGASRSPLGVDVEYIKARDIDLFKNIFSKKEWYYIMNAKDQIKAFYTIWTKKESFLKFRGDGLINNLNEICVIDLDFEYQFFIGEINNYIYSHCEEGIEGRDQESKIEKVELLKVIEYIKMRL